MYKRLQRFWHIDHALRNYDLIVEADDSFGDAYFLFFQFFFLIFQQCLAKLCSCLFRWRCQDSLVIELTTCARKSSSLPGQPNPLVELLNIVFRCCSSSEPPFEVVPFDRNRFTYGSDWAVQVLVPKGRTCWPVFFSAQVPADHSDDWLLERAQASCRVRAGGWAHAMEWFCGPVDEGRIFSSCQHLPPSRFDHWFFQRTESEGVDAKRSSVGARLETHSPAMSIKLRELIRSIRAAKTAAEDIAGWMPFLEHETSWNHYIHIGYWILASQAHSIFQASVAALFFKCSHVMCSPSCRFIDLSSARWQDSLQIIRVALT